MKYRFYVAVMLLAGCADTNTAVVEETGADVEYDIIADELQAPWSIAKDNTVFYVTQRSGSIVKIAGAEQTEQQVMLQQTLSTASEAGLLGFVLAPDFSTSQQAFAYYTYEAGREQQNRIVLLQLAQNRWQEKKVLLDDIPSGQYHHGGRLKIGPDGKLYATAGDASNKELAQQQHALAGKILRLNLDGTIPSDNPDPQSYVFSYGHRNPQGITWTTDGTMYASEHGQSAHDEVNRITANKNYGWPLIEGTETHAQMEAPLFTSGDHNTWAPSGMTTDDEYVYVAALRGEAVLAFHLETKKVTTLVNDVGRVRDVWLEDNTLYFITNNTDGRGTPSEQDDKLYSVELNK